MAGPFPSFSPPGGQPSAAGSGNASPDEVRTTALDVIEAWPAYPDAALPANTREFILVADDAGTYMHATRGVTAVLGYQSEDLIGLRIEDLAAIELQEQTPRLWAAFLADGRQEGLFQLRTKDGRVVSLLYPARAHHAVPGFHASRLWPIDEPEDVTQTVLS
jgi:PAS domain S-box-containing protein